MNKLLIIICSFLCLSIFSGCKKNDSTLSPALKEQTKRTVLTYMFQDSSLWEFLTMNINDMERGWNPAIDGTMLVYVDPSTRLTQFGGKPVLLEIQHDTTNIIVSKVVKVYPDIDATNADVFLQVQSDAIAMFPAESYGLVIAGHGNGFFVDEPDSKGLNGSDRWSDKGLDIDVLSKNLATHYDFMIFDACFMAEATTLYQLRNATDFVVASVELSPLQGFAFRSDLKALYTQPKADLFTFAKGSRDYYQTDPLGMREIYPNSYSTIGVYRMAAMEKLAAVTKKIVEKINLKYGDLEVELMKVVKDPKNKIEHSMFYPQDYDADGIYYYDMNLLTIFLSDKNETDLNGELYTALSDVVLQKLFAMSDKFFNLNSNYATSSANLSFYIPARPKYKFQDDAFYNRFEWSTASGFTTKWE